MPSAIPVATYRLQLTASFTFDDAASLAPYLKALGISHVYASPFLKARKGSAHGYDIVDHNVINPELGGEEGFERFSAALRACDLGLILDFVPNHMGVHFSDNKWWLDILEWGQKSPYADTFDVDWDTLPFRKKPGVLLPILGSHYGDALARGDIALRYSANEGSFSAWYFEHRLPIAPERYSEILSSIVSSGEASDPVATELLAIASRYARPNTPNRSQASEMKQALRNIAGAKKHIIAGLDHYRSGPGRPAQTHALHNLLERQHYRLAHWRLATSEINYRRFFDVNSLAGIKVEERAVFERIHGLVYRLVSEGKLHGIRLDHIDGLRDPAQYFQRLRTLIRAAQSSRQAPFYLLIEKILGQHEQLPRFAGLAGTTGYEWLNQITRLLAKQEGLDELDEIWRQVSNLPPQFDPILKDAKRRVLNTLLASEFTVLTRLLARIAAGHYSSRDYSEDSLRQALELFVLHFPVYRTYVTASGTDDQSRILIQSVCDKARADWFGADEGIFNFLYDALTLDLLKFGTPARGAERVRRFAMKMQQFTGPMMAKSLEDTSFYRFHRLLAFNEVGGDPSLPAITPAQFGALMTVRAESWPHGLTSTATHDTKRGEDARTRILALTELPGEWVAAVARWKLMNASHVKTSGGIRAPSITDEYMIYQALIGALPIGTVNSDFIERMTAYAIKATREAKQHTSWLNPNEAYENGITLFLKRILDSENSKTFLESLLLFASRTSILGALNSLSQLALKVTMPGVPDFYQGTELWDFSLVDPDNRRPVDFALRRDLFNQANGDYVSMARAWPSGLVKMALTRKLLAVRTTHSELFAHGNYIPLDVRGAHASHIIAFARVYRNQAIIVSVMRHFEHFMNSDVWWPRFDMLDATVDVSGFKITSQRGASNTGLDLALAFDVFPVVTISAKPHSVSD